MFEREKLDFEGEAVEKTPDGRLLMYRRMNYSPLQYGDDRAYFRLPSVETVLWLLTAASSGVVGNLAYDALKSLIRNARTLHKNFLSVLADKAERDRDDPRNAGLPPHHELLPLDYDTQPDPELRDHLVEIAYDVLARNSHLRAD